MSTATTTAQPVVRATLARFGPNWFATVMGTGIVASAAAGLPVAVPGLRTAATAVWLLALGLLVVVTVATALHHRRHRDVARAWLAHPVMGHFHGAAAMAPMSVGAGAVLVGGDVVGARPALLLAALLWSVGTGLGLWTTYAVPRPVGPAEAFHLMPVVPPMVSASLGALLAAHLTGPSQVVAVAVCWALFALAAVASAPRLAAVVRRVASGDVPDAAVTLFIVLGPLGQSVTAALLLAPLSPAPGRPVVLAYAVAATAAALAWLAVAARCAVRARPAFAMTWWSLTFPVGTVVTGLSGLAAVTGSGVVAGVVAAAAVGLYAALVAAWLLVAARTLAGVRSGALLC